MYSFSQKLKQTRMDKGMSLSAVEEKTKIRVKFISALENGNLDLLPGRIYTEGYIKSYAKFLDLDADEMLEEFRSNAENPETEINKMKEERRERLRRKRNRQKSLYFLAAAVFIAVLYFSGLFNTIFSGESDVSVPAGSLPADDAAIPSAAPEKNDITGSGLKSDEDEIPADLVLDVDDNSGVSERCWVRITSGGELVFEGEISEGEKKIFHDISAEKVEMTLGNAGVVQVTWQGEYLGYLGGMDKVVSRIFEASEENN